MTTFSEASRLFILKIMVLIILPDVHSKIILDVSKVAEIDFPANLTFLQNYPMLYISDTPHGIQKRLLELMDKGLLLNTSQTNEIIISLNNVSGSNDILFTVNFLKKYQLLFNDTNILLRISDVELESRHVFMALSKFKGDRKTTLGLGITVPSDNFFLLVNNANIRIVDVIEIEVQPFIYYINYSFFKSKIDKILEASTRLSGTELRISIPMYYHPIGRYPDRRWESVARYALITKQMAIKYSVEKPIVFIFKNLTSWQYFDGFERDTGFNDESPFAYELDKSMYVSWSGLNYIPIRNVTAAAITAAKVLGEDYKTLLVTPRLFDEAKTLCDVARSFQTPNSFQEIWLFITVMSDGESSLLSSMLKNMSREKENFECVTSLVLSADDLLTHLNTLRRVNYQNQFPMQSVIADFNTTLRLTNLSLILFVSRGESRKEIAQRLSRILETRTTESPLQQIYGIAQYFVLPQTTIIKNAVASMDKFLENMYTNSAVFITDFLIFMQKFPSIRPIFGTHVVWYHTQSPNFCDIQNSVTSVDVLDIIKLTMYIHQIKVLELQLFVDEDPNVIVYGKFHVQPGAHLDSRRSYTDVSTATCIKWNPHPENRTELHTNFSGISVNPHDFQDKDFIQVDGVKILLPLVLLTRKFQIVEVRTNLQNLKATLDEFIRAVKYTRSNYRLFISATEAKKEWEYYNEVVKMLMPLNDVGISVEGIHFPVNLADTQINQIEGYNSIAQKFYNESISYSVLFTDCGVHPEHFISLSGALLLTRANYVICDLLTRNVVYQTGRASGANYVTISQVAETAINLRSLLTDRLNLTIEVMLRIGWPKDANLSEKDNSVEFLKFSYLVTELCKANSIPYFLYEAFEQDDTSYFGWWRVEKQEGLTHSFLYVERESEALGVETWIPVLNNTSGTETSKTSRKTWIVVSVVSVVGFLLLVATLVFIRRILVKKASLLSDEQIKEFFDEASYIESELENMASYVGLKMKYDVKYEIPISKVFIDKKQRIGSGNFGSVYKAKFTDTQRGQLAAKVPISGSKEALKSILCEIKVMQYIGKHPNVLMLVGACTTEIRQGKVYVFTEFCKHGSLLSYLHYQSATFTKSSQADPKTENIVPKLKQFCSFGKNVATGMEYISCKQVVHGDLSARNILVDENFVCKISDFGLSTKLYNAAYVNKKLSYIPWRWMAVESLGRMNFSTKSDVWSFGVILWEIFTLGAVPYSGLNWSCDFTTRLENGLRLPKPKYASEELYQTMRKCWYSTPGKRPTYTNIITALECFESNLQ